MQMQNIHIKQTKHITTNRTICLNKDPLREEVPAKHLTYTTTNNNNNSTVIIIIIILIMIIMQYV